MARNPERRQKHRPIDETGAKPRSQKAELRQSSDPMNQQINQRRIGRDRGEHDPQSGLRAIDRAHEPPDGQEGEAGADPPGEAEQILLGLMRGGGRLPEGPKDWITVKRQRQHRHRDQDGGPQSRMEGLSNEMRLTGPERLGGQRRNCRYQPHAERETDEKDGMRQRCGGDGGITEPPDQRQIGGHHRDLTELRQRNRRGKSERRDEFTRKSGARSSKRRLGGFHK